MGKFIYLRLVEKYGQHEEVTMKRAFWYDETHMDQQIAEVDTTEAHVVRFAKNYGNTSVTENGAVGYRTTTKALLDLNFRVSSLRNRSESEII